MRMRENHEIPTMKILTKPVNQLRLYFQWFEKQHLRKEQNSNAVRRESDLN